MARNVDAETARRHAAWLAELEALLADIRVVDDTPVSPPAAPRPTACAKCRRGEGDEWCVGCRRHVCSDQCWEPNAERCWDCLGIDPPSWVVAPEGIPPFSFLIQRHAHPAAAPRTPRQHPARADQLGVSLNPPPEAPPRVPSAQEETLPYKGPPAMAVPRPSLQAPAREERPRYKGPSPLVVPRPRLPHPPKPPPALLRQPRPPPPSLQVSAEQIPTPPASKDGGPPDLAGRLQAMKTQTMELWELNQLCGQEFDHLAHAIKYAHERGFISEAERRRLQIINKAGNDAKHKGLGSRAGSRSPTPVGHAARAGSRSATPVARAPSRAVSSRDPAPISAPLPLPWGPGESHPAASGWV